MGNNRQWVTGRITDVTGAQGGSAYLIEGSERTALYDCGMAYCAPRMLARLRAALAGRGLDYILISHTHYDHIAAMPYLRRLWPGVEVLGSDYAGYVLGRQGALDTMRRLSLEAAHYYGAGGIEDYDDRELRVDRAVGEGERVSLGDVEVKVLETPGHTKCSLSFLVGGEVLLASESTCYKSLSGRVLATFPASCVQAMASVEHCAAQGASAVLSPHYGLVEEAPAAYWERCRKAIAEARDYILAAQARGEGVQEILAGFDLAFRDQATRAEQPQSAFEMNTLAMIRTVARERAQGLI